MDVTFEGKFLRVRVTVEDDYQTSMEFFTKLAGPCAEYNCRNILVISDSIPLAMMDAYDHAKIIKEAGFTIKHCLAWVEMNPKAREMDKFIETVVVNRGLIQVWLFSDESEARTWFLGNRVIFQLKMPLHVESLVITAA